MLTDFVEELRWRNMLHDSTPGADELLRTQRVRGYIGFDPTSDSLGVGNLVQVMTLLHFQRAGHQPIALVGGATGMVGDPSGKSAERNLLSAETLEQNVLGQRRQLERFLDFSPGPCAAEIVNNYDWMKDFTFLEFLRDVGKYFTVNTMMAKDSVKKRISGDDREGMSFTEFSYQLVQGYDFYWLWKNKGVQLQMGGSDQWGNIVSGTELVRRKGNGEAFALTTRLIAKADGTKFGKTETGNLWLDPAKTPPYEFYQFWLNASDEDAATYIRIFSLEPREALEALVAEHAKAPHLRTLQRALAREVTRRVHDAEELATVEAATEILFGKGTVNQLMALSAARFVSVFVAAGVPVADVARDALAAGVPVVELFSEKSGFIASKSEATRLLRSNSLAINKEKCTDPKASVGLGQLINEQFLLLQRGKKDYLLIRVV